MFAHHEAIMPLLPQTLIVGGMVAITGYAMLRQVFTPTQQEEKSQTKAEDKRIDSQQPPT